jgi:hypothetical protein
MSTNDSIGTTPQYVKDAIEDINKKHPVDKLFDKKSLGIFIGQSKTKIVRGRRKYMIKNRFAATCPDPESVIFCQETWPEEFTDLQKMYYDFCEKAYKYMMEHRDNQGGFMPCRTLFPDFYYEVIPERLTIE